MKNENLKQLSTWLKESIKSGNLSHDIRNPTYQSLYFNVFFDEIQNGEPIPYDRFSERLTEYFEQDEANYKVVIESFMRTWNAWVALYRELNKRGILRVKDDIQ